MPKADSVNAVNAWLSENELSATPLTSSGEWLALEVPVSKANELFDADFTVFTHSASGQQSVRTLSYSIPTDLVGHLDLVHPTVTLVFFLGPSRIAHGHVTGSLPLSKASRASISRSYMPRKNHRCWSAWTTASPPTGT